MEDQERLAPEKGDYVVRGYCAGQEAVLPGNWQVCESWQELFEAMQRRAEIARVEAVKQDGQNEKMIATWRRHGVWGVPETVVYREKV
jgi:hypothetical protein